MRPRRHVSGEENAMYETLFARVLMLLAIWMIAVTSLLFI
jgi:hypothetical protein